MFGSTKAYLRHGHSQSVQMAGLQIRLGSTGFITLRSIPDTRPLEAKGSSFLTTMEVVAHQISDHSVKINDGDDVPLMGPALRVRYPEILEEKS